MTRDLIALGVANVALIGAGHGVLRLVGIRAAAADLPWSLGVAYVTGAAATGVLGATALVLGLALTWWQFVAGWGVLLIAGLIRGGERPAPGLRANGWVRVLPVAIVGVLGVLALDLAVQPLWTDDSWSIWAAKSHSIAILDGLDPDVLSSASVFNADYPLVVPVLELVALRFCGLPNELVPLQLGLVFFALPFALVALVRDRVPPVLHWTVALSLVLAPSLQIQNASAVADVPLAVFFALCGVAGWRWVERGETEMLWLAGIFGAAAVNTKVEGVIFVGVLFAALGATAFRRGRPLRRFLLVGTAAVASVIPWELWERAHSLDNAFSSAGGAGAVDLLAEVDRPLRAAGAIAREIADPTSWLGLVALAAVAIGLAFRRGGQRELAVYTSAVTLVSLATLVAVYWATPLDFDYHVATSVRRVITAPLVFAAAMSPLLLWRAASGQRER